MIYLYIYIVLAVIFAIFHTITYSKQMNKVDPRVEYVSKGTIRVLVVLTFIISVVLAPAILVEKIYIKIKGVKQ